MDVWWNNHFLCKDWESTNWNNHFLMVVWGSRYIYIQVTLHPANDWCNFGKRSSGPTKHHKRSPTNSNSMIAFHQRWLVTMIWVDSVFKMNKAMKPNWASGIQLLNLSRTNLIYIIIYTLYYDSLKSSAQKGENYAWFFSVGKCRPPNSEYVSGSWSKRSSWQSPTPRSFCPTSSL